MPGRTLVLAAIMCSSAVPATALDSHPTASPVTDNGTTTVGAAGLAELQRKVSGRDDLVGEDTTGNLLRYDTRADGTYFFTTGAAAAHPFALYCGRSETGALEIRAWAGGEPGAAETLKARLKARIGAADQCTVPPG